MKPRTQVLLLLVSLITLGSACKKDDDNNTNPTGQPRAVTTEKVVTRTITDLFSGPVNTTTAVYFNLRTGREVPPDSLTALNWDLSFKRAEMRINSGVSEQGNAGVVIVEEDISNFDNEKFAPETGYLKDGEGPEDESGFGGVKGLVFNNWFIYDAQTVQAKNDRIYFIRTADSYYAKLIISSYYNSQDATRGGFYTFTYTYQPGGSKDFSKK